MLRLWSMLIFVYPIFLRKTDGSSAPLLMNLVIAQSEPADSCEPPLASGALVVTLTADTGAASKVNGKPRPRPPFPEANSRVLDTRLCFLCGRRPEAFSKWPPPASPTRVRDFDLVVAPHHELSPNIPPPPPVLTQGRVAEITQRAFSTSAIRFVESVDFGDPKMCIGCTTSRPSRVNRESTPAHSFICSTLITQHTHTHVVVFDLNE